ncbi:MAG: hypothetical protein D6718_02110 [Acidobacteria bacterium]|nr:MAG: hypothetical protein D6718_02110 [Acidobacteriota bacterium]
MSALLAAALLLAPAAAPAGAAGEPSLERARRLTWDRETRELGIAMLRELARLRPGDVDVGLELGRVLTWSEATRQEGVAILRRLAEEAPARFDVAEALAEVLSWSAETRPEAVRILREVVARAPDRRSAWLLLAEILSWGPATREEAADVYRRLIRRDPDDARARAGLARLLSWEGDFGQSLDAYREALARDPAEAEARVGLAEVLGWTGRPRAALAALDELGDEQADSPRARRARAELLEALGRPAAALHAYETLLAIDPSDAGARRAAERLRWLLAPHLGLTLSGSTESGDPDTSRLRFAEAPLSLRWHPGGSDSELTLLAGRGFFANRRGSTRRTEVGVAWRSPIGRRLRVDGRLLHLDHDATGGRDWSGRIGLRVWPGDRVALDAFARREPELSSRMTAAGEVIGGIGYGPVFLREAGGGAAFRFGRRWDAVVRFARGTIAGANVRDNGRRTAYAGLGVSFRLAGGRWRLGYSYFAMSHDRDLGGFPPADLQGDGLGARGAGGYFSPLSFRNQMLRADVSWAAPGRWRVELAAAAGRQRVRDVAAPAGAGDTSSEVRLAYRRRIGRRLELLLSGERLDVAAAFDRTRVTLALDWALLRPQPPRSRGSR